MFGRDERLFNLVIETRDGEYYKGGYRSKGGSCILAFTLTQYEMDLLGMDGLTDLAYEAFKEKGFDTIEEAFKSSLTLPYEVDCIDFAGCSIVPEGECIEPDWCDRTCDVCRPRRAA